LVILILEEVEVGIFENFYGESTGMGDDRVSGVLKRALKQVI
jgi:hypothetical protein